MLLAGTVLAQRVEVPLDVAHRAEVDRALDAQDLELGALEEAVLDLRHLAPGMARIGHEAAQDRVGCAIEVQHQRDEHAHEDRELEVEQERRKESDREHRALAPARGKDFPDALKVDQVPGDEEQQPRYDRDRQVGDQRCHCEQHEHQQQRGKYRRHRSPRARIVVDAAAVGGGARRKAREEGRGDVGEALGDEFLVVVEALSRLERDGVGDRERLRERHQRDGDGARQEALQRCRRDVRE